MKKNSPNYNLSKSMIADALFKLMKEKHFSKITITELTDVAQLARRTFYKHFKTKEEVIDYKVSQINDEYTSQIENTNISSPEEFGIFFFTFFKKYSDILLVLDNHNLLFSTIYYIYRDYMNENTEYVKKLKINLSIYNISYRYGGIFFMLLEWIKNGLVETPETMAKLLDKEIKE